jgi:hypothetical protein
VAVSSGLPRSGGGGVVRDRGTADRGIVVPSSREATYSGGVPPVGAAAGTGAVTQPVAYSGSAEPAASGWSGHGRWHRGRRSR